MLQKGVIVINVNYSKKVRGKYPPYNTKRRTLVRLEVQNFSHHWTRIYPGSDLYELKGELIEKRKTN